MGICDRSGTSPFPIEALTERLQPIACLLGPICRHGNYYDGSHGLGVLLAGVRCRLTGLTWGRLWWSIRWEEWLHDIENYGTTNVCR